MKTNLVAILLLSSSFVFSGFAFAQSTSIQNNTTSTQPGMMNNGDANNTMNNQNDARILGIIEQIDKNEIGAADAAIGKSTTSDVKDFANAMKSDHTKNLNDAQNLVSKYNFNMTASNKADALRKKGELQLKNLNALQGSEFDTSFADDMIKGHSEVLNLISTVLLPKASSPDVVSFLKDTQQVVAHHLEMAKDLKSKLPKK